MPLMTWLRCFRASASLTVPMKWASTASLLGQWSNSSSGKFCVGTHTHTHTHTNEMTTQTSKKKKNLTFAKLPSIVEKIMQTIPITYRKQGRWPVKQKTKQLTQNNIRVNQKQYSSSLMYRNNNNNNNNKMFFKAHRYFSSEITQIKDPPLKPT